LEFKNLIDQKESSVDLVCDKKSSMIKDFAMGAFLCGSNPAFIMFWLMVAKWLDQYDPTLSSLGNASYVYVFFGIAIGDGLWYSFFAKLVQMGLSFISMRFIFYLRQTISGLLIILGVLAVINYI
jgi:threonine/homoserine/homoserine lactone efflux protein